MSCAEIEPELVGYHFNTLSEEARGSVEAHLVECGSCVRAYVELKRAIETSERAPAPSELARARLRRAVARELGIESNWSWWERPLALAVAASIVLVAGAITHALSTSSGSAPHALTESAE